MFRSSARVEQAVAHERDELVDLLTRQADRCGQDWIDARQHWLYRASRAAEIGGELLARHSVLARRRDHVQVMAHGVLKARKSPIVHKCGLHGEIAQRRCTKLVAILGIARDLLA